MAEHDLHGAGSPTEPWPGGWLVALIAGIVAAILAAWLGSSSGMAAVLIGIFVFLVFGVLLGMFWDRPSPNALGAHAGGHHGDEDEGHGHAEADSEPVAAVAPAVTVPVETAREEAPEPEAERAAEAPTGEPEPETAAHPAAEASVEEPAEEPSEEPVAAQAAAEGGEDGKPEGIDAPRGGQADDLKEIDGIGPALEKRCHELGIYHYDQIAAWGEAEVAWMDGNLKGFKGRVTRDKWVAQAKLIVDEGLEAFRIRAKTNDY